MFLKREIVRYFEANRTALINSERYLNPFALMNKSGNISNLTVLRAQFTVKSSKHRQIQMTVQKLSHSVLNCRKSI